MFLTLATMQDLQSSTLLNLSAAVVLVELLVVQQVTSADSAAATAVLVELAVASAEDASSVAEDLVVQQDFVALHCSVESLEPL